MKADEYLIKQIPMEGNYGLIAIGNIDRNSFDWHLTNTFKGKSFKLLEETDEYKVSIGEGKFNNKLIKLYLLEFKDGSRVLEYKE